MIRTLVEKITQVIQEPETDKEAERARALRIATAVLMADVARADYDFDEDEFTKLLDLVQLHFGLSAEDATQLANEASEVAEDLVSLHEFTSLLHKNLDETEKEEVVALLWRIAYADGSLDKYEDSLVLKISDLLYVSRGRVMQLKAEAQAAAASS
ncbi:MAG: TerB family tellurite resistance protein [Woeseiaceae bacterium]|jgi:uncharacterized tellurite resistance protein B-like protein|nr:TerB family tellurite resistance protein [Woeseiaceae bacterium]